MALGSLKLAAVVEEVDAMVLGSLKVAAVVAAAAVEVVADEPLVAAEHKTFIFNILLVNLDKNCRPSTVSMNLYYDFG